MNRCADCGKELALDAGFTWALRPAPPDPSGSFPAGHWLDGGPQYEMVCSQHACRAEPAVAAS